MTANPTLKSRLQENERLLRETGHLFGMQSLKRKREDPGTYEAVWHILLNGMNAAWDIGCKVSASPVAADLGKSVPISHSNSSSGASGWDGIPAWVMSSANTPLPPLPSVPIRTLRQAEPSWGSPIFASSSTSGPSSIH